MTRNSKVFTKEGLSHIVQVNPLSPQPVEAALFAEYQGLVAAEKESVQAVR